MAQIFPTPRSNSQRPPSLAELRQQVKELEALQKRTGASAIEQDRPGLFATVVDLLSRPNYAVAGITEEVLNGKSVTSAFARGVNELLSGVGDFEGDKRAFGQVLEARGVPTKTLAQVFPLLENTWVGNFGSRGAAGIALDIFTDPLTYLTFGASSARAVTLKSGRHFLSREGIERMGTIRRAFDDEFSKTLDISDSAVRINKQKAISNQARDLFEDELIDKSGKILKSEFIDPGGIKFFGQLVPLTSGLGRRFSASTVAAINTIPGGEQALKGAAEFRDGALQTVRALFHPNNELGKLPPELRAEAIRLHRDFSNARALHAGRLVQQVKQLEKIWNREIKKDPDLGKKFYEIREQTAKHTLTPDQAQLYQGFVQFYDQALDTALNVGVLDPDMARVGYFHHGYSKNSQKELQLYHSRAGRSEESLQVSFRKERPFDTYDEAVRVSREAHDLWRLGDGARYPALEPDYDLLTNTYRYVDQHSSSISRKAWQEQLKISFGADVLPWDSSGRFEIAKQAASTPQVQAQFESFFGDKRNFRDLAEEGLKVHPIEKGAKIGERKSAGSEILIQDANRILARLGDADKRAFLNRLVSTTRSSWQMAEITLGIEKRFQEFLPSAKGIQAGEAVPLKHFGVQTDYVERSGGFWGDSTITLPKIIADDFEKINSKVFNTREHKEFGQLLRGFDKINNIFKLGVYTFWPASAFRDIYSNVALAMLDIGVGALNPLAHIHSVALMAGRSTRIGGQLIDRELAKQLGVIVPGEVFAELTGNAAKSGTVAKALKSAAQYRGLLENEARVQLWVQNMRRGLSPRDAADKVRDFLFDYGELSSVERELFRRFIPFYTFTRKNIELQAKILRSKPGLAINQIKPFRQRDEESEMMVKWEAESLGLRLDRDGKTVHAIQGVDLPLRNLDTLWKGTTIGSARSIMGMVTPVLKVPLEVISGRDFFTGSDLKRTRGDAIGRGIDWLDQNATFPAGVKNWIGYKKDFDRAGRPIYTFDGTRYALLARSWVFSRAISTSDRQFREYLGDENISGAMMDFFFGLRDKEINLSEQQRRVLSRRIRQLQQSLVRRGAQAEFQRTFTPSRRGQLQ